MKKERDYTKRFEKEYGFWRTLYTWLFAFLVIRPVAKLMYNLKVEGKENLPKTTRLIIAPNHVSYCDPPFVGVALWRHIAFMAKRELFHLDAKMPIKSITGRKILFFLAHTLGAFEVNREDPEMKTFSTVDRIFNTHWSLGIFPEGGIRQDKKIRNIKRGFVYFAKKYQADIIPVGVCGFTWYATKLFEKNMTIKIGKPIPYTMEEDEIIREWARQISDMTGFENMLEKNCEKELQTKEVSDILN